jgi:GDSL-like lipase/acylhydrolase family protein
MPQPRGHVVLLGDSVFDNAVYTSGAPDVVTHLRALLPTGWQATLLARDGATTGELAPQLRRIPTDASHLVVSIGGNDILGNLDLLSLKVASSAEALEICAARAASFERDYRRAIRQTLALQRTTAVCTVYNGALDAVRAVAARTGLAIFNDAILRAAVDFQVDALELRSICTEQADYANPIEPSGEGGLKIARAIACVIGAVARSSMPSRVWGAC